MKKRAKLSEKDVDIIKSSKLTGVVLADIMGCSIGTIDYHRNRGIWSKKKVKKIIK